MRPALHYTKKEFNTARSIAKGRGEKFVTRYTIVTRSGDVTKWYAGATLPKYVSKRAKDVEKKAI
jgi:hypothetical protein